MPTSLSKGAIAAVIVAVFATTYNTFQPSFFSALSPSLYTSVCGSAVNISHSNYLSYGCAAKPHHSSWDSWWHPQRTETKNEHGAGTITQDWNILYHLGGNGPWVEKVVDVVEGGIATPEGCEVLQVHMVCFRSEVLGLHVWSSPNVLFYESA